jgi:ABC-2 type transport system permease protein
MNTLFAAHGAPRTFLTLLKREFWENKGGLLWAPIVTSAIFLALTVMALTLAEVGIGKSNIQIGALNLDKITQNLDENQRASVGAAIDISALMTAGQISIVVAIVVFFYCLGALYDERRDRSVLFWKSLPVSDRDTVLSKAATALVIAPVIGILVGIATGLGMHLLLAIYLAFHGINIFDLLLGAASPMKVIGYLLGTIPLNVIWALPTVGWLLLCSAWAKSKPFLWAIALPVGAGVLVTWFDVMRSLSLPDSWFWTHVVARLVGSIIPGSWINFESLERANIRGPEDFMDIASLGSFYQVLLQPSIWIWAAIGIAMIIVAIRLRRWRDDG